MTVDNLLLHCDFVWLLVFFVLSPAGDAEECIRVVLSERCLW